MTSLARWQGALFESEHSDENCVQTMKHRCLVVSYNEYLSATSRSSSSLSEPVFYLAGSYDAGRRKVLRRDV